MPITEITTRAPVSAVVWFDGDGHAMKKCSQCGEAKRLTVENFSIKESLKTGFASACKACISGNNKKYRERPDVKERRAIMKRTYRTERGGDVKAKQWQDAKRLVVLTHYGNGFVKCACCGETEIKFLAIDHIGGGGRKLLREEIETPSSLIKDGLPNGRRILCHNCNCSAGHWGVCAHIQPLIVDVPHTKLIKAEWFGVKLEFTCGKSRADYQRARQRAMREYAIRYYSKGAMKCECCGEAQFKFLTFDHINGGGNQHYKQLKSGHMPNWLFKNGFPDGFRILCYNCNMSDGIHKGCPHSQKLKVVTEVQGVCINATS